MYWVEVYRALGDPSHAYHRYFERNVHVFTPFHLAEFGIQYSLAATLSPVLAQKVHASLIVLLWAGALHFLAISLRGHLTLGALTALLLIHSAWLYGGFFGFMGAIPLVLLTLGILARLARGSSRRSPPTLYFGIAVLGVVAYFAHLFVAALFVLLCGLWWLTVTPTHSYRRTPLLFAAAPAALLIVWYLAAGTVGGGGARWEPLPRAAARFAGLAFFRGLAAPQLSFWVALGTLAAVLIALCWTALRARREGLLQPLDRFIVTLGVVATVLFFLAPETVGEAGNFNGRIQLAMWAWLLPALPYALTPKFRLLLTSAAVCLLCWQVVTFSLRARRLAVHYETALEAIEPIPPGATLEAGFPYESARYEGSFLRVLAHLPEDIARRREAALPVSFFPALDFYWVRLKPGVAVQPDFRVNLRHEQGDRFSLVVIPLAKP
jgi:hypothetical protein